MHPTVEVGSSLKTVGHRGAIKMDIKSPYDLCLEHIEILLLKVDGDMVPYWIQSIEQRGAGFIVEFKDILNPEDAKRLSNRLVFMLERDVLKYIEMVPAESQHPLIGYYIMDQYDHHIGFIQSIEQYPHQEMALVEFNNQLRLIPLNNSCIIARDDSNKMIQLTLPEGLLEL